MGNNFIIDNCGYVCVWVDGSCLRNGQPGARAGLGVFYNWNHYMNVSEPVNGRATNNVGEIQAVTRAIRDCIDENIRALLIHTDSDFLYKSLTVYIKKWRENGFCKANGEPLANQDDFMELNDVIKSKGNMQIQLKKVQAHSGNKFNDAADKLAKNGAQQYNPWY